MNTLPQKQFKRMKREVEEETARGVGYFEGILEHIPSYPLSEAVKGNVYYFTGNKKFYICKESQSRRVSVPDGNFEELSIWENRKRLENLFKIDSHNDITTIKFGNVVIIYGTFRNVRFNESTDIVIPVTFKNASISAIPWHTGTPGNLTTMAYVNGNKITIRINNHDTGLQNASGTFIITGIV